MKFGYYYIVHSGKVFQIKVNNILIDQTNALLLLPLSEKVFISVPSEIFHLLILDWNPPTT